MLDTVLDGPLLTSRLNTLSTHLHANHHSSMNLLTVYVFKQVAQLWQRDHAKLDTFAINAQRFFVNSHKIEFWGHPMGASEAI